MIENGTVPPPLEGKQSTAAPPDPEVVEKPSRRRFNPPYKLRIGEKADACTEPGAIGQLSGARVGTTSHLTTWRMAARTGSLEALSRKRGRKPGRHPLEDKVRKLEREKVRLERELHKARLIIDVQGRVAGLLG